MYQSGAWYSPSADSGANNLNVWFLWLQHSSSFEQESWCGILGEEV